VYKQGRERLATVAERTHDNRDPVLHAGMIEDTARDRGVVGVEFDRVKMRVFRHRARCSQVLRWVVRAHEGWWIPRAAGREAPR